MQEDGEGVATQPAARNEHRLDVPSGRRVLDSDDDRVGAKLRAHPDMVRPA